MSGLAAIAKEGKDGILSGLKELEAAGYLERHRYRNERGRLGDSEYVIYEIPRHVRPVPATPEQDSFREHITEGAPSSRHIWTSTVSVSTAA